MNTAKWSMTAVIAHLGKEGNEKSLHNARPWYLQAGRKLQVDPSTGVMYEFAWDVFNCHSAACPAFKSPARSKTECHSPQLW